MGIVADASGAVACAAGMTHALTGTGTHAVTDTIRLPGGRFQLGAEDGYPEERPARQAEVAPFAIAVGPVTNAQFTEFVAATGYRTLAERPVAAGDYPDADPALLVPGSAVFTPPDHPVPLDDALRWWSYLPGACWFRPEGPGSDLDGRGEHPVVHVAYEDASAYATWVGGELPTEEQWEYAARGGIAGASYAWGEQERPGGRVMANTWVGRFPWQNLNGGGYAGTSAVGAFPPNGFGLSDMIGNVWEWTRSLYVISHGGGGGDDRSDGCCGHDGSDGGCGHDRAGRTEPDASSRTTGPDASSRATGPDASSRATGPDASSRATERLRTVKGGSHLCAPNYCRRYRPAARQGQTEVTSTSHIGFRVVWPLHPPQ